jgi:integrase/recombinase XerD
MAGGAAMLVQAVESYLALRHACGFELKREGNLLRSFAAYSDARGEHRVCSEIAIEWAGFAQSIRQRARRLNNIIRFARHVRAEDQSHELPPAVFGSGNQPRSIPYIFSPDNIVRLMQAAVQSVCHPFRKQTYSVLFALLSCTGLRVSEAIALCLEDITTDGMIIRRSKFGKNRLVPIHETTRAALQRYVECRRPYAPFDNHVFVSLRGKPLSIDIVERVFRSAVRLIDLKRGERRPTPHSLRHTFAVRALEGCPLGREHIAEHMVALSTYLGHSSVSDTYWYLEATPELMESIGDRCEVFFSGGRS